MKSLFTFIFLSIVSFSSIGQIRVSNNTECQIGEPYAGVTAEHQFYFSRNGEIMSVKFGKYNIVVQKFDAITLEEIKRVENPALADKASLEEVLEVGGRYFIFFREKIPETKLEGLYKIEIDFMTGKITPNRELLVTPEVPIRLTELQGTNLFLHYIKHKYEFSFSEDKSKLLIQYLMRGKMKKQTNLIEEAGLCAFDSDLKLLWQKTIKMPYPYSNCIPMDYAVDSKGTGYVLVKVTDDANASIRKYVINVPNHHYELLKINPNAATVAIINVKGIEKINSKVKLKEINGQMIGAGFLYAGSFRKKNDGVCYFKLDAAGQSEGLKAFNMTDEIIDEYTGGARRKLFKNLFFDDIVPFDDGSFLLVGERRYKEQDVGGSKPVYYYNDVLVAKISATGSLAWMKKLPKRQKSLKPVNSLSYTAILNSEKDRYNLLYLDNDKNLKLPTYKKPAVYNYNQNGFLALYQTDSNTGNPSKAFLLNMKDIGGVKIKQFNHGSLLPTSDGAFLVELEGSGNKAVWVKVKK